jgi:hypothetical protein
MIRAVITREALIEQIKAMPAHARGRRALENLLREMTLAALRPRRRVQAVSRPSETDSLRRKAVA